MNCSAPTRRKSRGSHSCRTALVLDALRAAKGLAAQRVSRARTRRNVHANWERQKKGYGQPRKGSKAVATKPHKPPMPLHAPPPDKWPYAPDRSNKRKRGKNCREAELDHHEKQKIPCPPQRRNNTDKPAAIARVLKLTHTGDGSF